VQTRDKEVFINALHLVHHSVGPKSLSAAVLRIAKSTVNINRKTLLRGVGKQVGNAVAWLHCVDG